MSVAVTGEEDHEDVLAAAADGRSGPAALYVEVRPDVLVRGKGKGQEGLVVLLDGRRVGELTQGQSAKYLPVVREAAARGRVGCEAKLDHDHRGWQVSLRLPKVS